MNEHINRDIINVIEAIEIISSVEYTIKGKVRNVSQIKIIDPSGNLDTTQVKHTDYTDIFYKVLTSDIYNSLYVHTESESVVDSQYEDDFINHLSKSNNGKGTWEEDWQLIGHDNERGKFIVQKNKINFWVNEHDVIFDEHSVVIGMPCTVKIEKEVRHLNSHFYMVLGNATKKDIPVYEDTMLRFYWNLQPDGAVKYIKLVTESFNQQSILFRTKVLSDPFSYNRADAGVLYIDNSQLNVAIPYIREIHKEIKPYLKNNVPLFSKQIAKGLGFAEDPANGNSFGISRSTIIAHAMYDSFLNGKRDTNDIIQIIEKYFENEGINSQFPYAKKNRLTYYEDFFKHNI